MHRNTCTKENMHKTIQIKGCYGYAAYLNRCAYPKTRGTSANDPIKFMQPDLFANIKSKSLGCISITSRAQLAAVIAMAILPDSPPPP
jgi:hypothetical protein